MSIFEVYPFLKEFDDEFKNVDIEEKNDMFLPDGEYIVNVKECKLDNSFSKLKLVWTFTVMEPQFYMNKEIKKQVFFPDENTLPENRKISFGIIKSDFMKFGYTKEQLTSLESIVECMTNVTGFSVKIKLSNKKYQGKDGKEYHKYNIYIQEVYAKEDDSSQEDVPF